MINIDDNFELVRFNRVICYWLCKKQNLFNKFVILRMEK